MKIITETERLIIREIVESDIVPMLELHSDPEVHLYLADKLISSRERMIEILAWLRQQYLDRGVGRWAMIDKNTNEFVGWIGLEYVAREVNNHKNFYDLGYRLLKKHWRRGYATESAIASLKYAFEILNINEVYAMADVANDGSNKILKNIGLSFIETFDFEGVGHNWYRIEKLEYEELNSYL